MRRIAMMAGLALATAVLTGCPPTYPKCDSDAQCQEKGEVCVQGACQECATDANCKEGFVCQANKCVPKPPECTRDEACGEGRICEAGKCAQAQCTTSAGCGEGQQCAKGRCVALPPGACVSNTDCGEGEECQENHCVATAPKCDWSPVHFEFNESSLTSESQERLQGVAQCLSGESVPVTLGGHADERGTEEYNLQLSQRRAEAVKKYLVDLGIPSSRLKPVGFGENRPLDTASTEEAWSANRCVEFVR